MRRCELPVIGILSELWAPNAVFRSIAHLPCEMQERGLSCSLSEWFN